nr:unnamed protein product [Callosobruchus analis]
MVKRFVFVSFIVHPTQNYRTVFSTWLQSYPNVS